MTGPIFQRGARAKVGRRRSCPVRPGGRRADCERAGDPGTDRCERFRDDRDGSDTPVRVDLPSGRRASAVGSGTMAPHALAIVHNKA